MSDASYDLHELIEISRNGMDFYHEAATKVDDKGLRKAFTQMALAKSSLADELSTQIQASKARRGKSHETSTELQKAYGDLRSEISTVRLSHINLLEQTEGVLQNSVQKVVMDRGNSCVIRVLAKQYVSNVEVFKTELRARKRDLS